MAKLILPRLGSFAKRLVWAREQAGFTSPRKAAKEYGWPDETYRKHESGARGKLGIPIQTVQKYARAFRVPWVWLLTGEETISKEDAALLEAVKAATLKPKR